jgi:hypothetical protein
MLRRLASLLVSATAFVAAHGFSHAQDQQSGLSGPPRDSFVGAAMRTCFEGQLANPANAGISRPFVIAYCWCYTNSLADRLSPRDLDESAPLTDDQKAIKLKPAIEYADTTCGKDVRDKIDRSLR